MRRWKKLMLSCFVVGIVWSLSTTCMADESISGNRVDRMTVLEDRIEEELEKGSASFTIYIDKKIETEQLQEINSRLDGFYGYVDRYSQWRFPFVSYYKTIFYLNNSDNYYVLAHLTGNYSFTEEQKKGKELADKVEEIQDDLFTASMSDYEKVVAVHDYLVDHSAYEEKKVSTGSTDEYNAYGVLVNHRGVCSSYTQAFHLFMKLNEIESRIVLGEADGVSHSWNLVCLDGEWYHVDTTWDDPVPDAKDRRIYAYLNVTDEFMEASHEWNREDYPKATSTKYNYYVQNDSVVENQEEFTDYVRQRLREEDEMITCLVKDYREKDYGSSLFQNMMSDTKAVSLNLQMYGEGKDKAFLLIPDYGRSLDE